MYVFFVGNACSLNISLTTGKVAPQFFHVRRFNHNSGQKSFPENNLISKRIFQIRNDSVYQLGRSRSQKVEVWIK